jgi:DNA-binding response OmpR family regulator
VTQNNGKVLIIEDNKNFLETVKDILELKGFVTDTLSSGRNVFEKIREFKPEIILLDVVLPDADGFELCKKIKSRPEGHDIPIILMTGYEQIDIDKGFSFGADDCIFKPLDMDDVINRIKKLTKRRNIMIVEDDRKIVEMLNMMLKDQKFDLSIHYDGKGVIDSFKDLKPDLILMDINLQVPPDGLVLAREIKSNPDLKGIPIIMLTGNDDTHSVEKSFEYGADDYIFKPFKVQELMLKIRKYLEN